MWMNPVWTFERYMGNGLLAIFFLATVVYLFFAEKRKPYRILFVYTPVLILLCYFNPLVYKLFYRAVDDGIYYRIMWLLPMSTEICFGIVSIASKLQGMKRKCFVVICASMIILGGSFVYTNPFFQKAQNLYHVPQTVVDICDMVHVDGREVVVAMPMEFVNYVRQYDATICLAYGRSADVYYDELGFLLEQQEINVEEAVEKARARGCHYIVLAQTKSLSGRFTDYDYELFLVKDGYMIYKDTTQYFGL